MSVERSNGSKNGKATYIDVSICKPGLKDPQDDVLVQGGIQSEVLHLGLIHGSGCSPGGRVFGFNRNEGGGAREHWVQFSLRKRRREEKRRERMKKDQEIKR